MMSILTLALCYSTIEDKYAAVLSMCAFLSCVFLSVQDTAACGAIGHVLGVGIVLGTSPHLVSACMMPNVQCTFIECMCYLPCVKQVLSRCSAC